MPSSEVTINITLKDKEIIPTPDLPTPDNPTPDLPVTEGSIAIYNIVYDLGSRKTAKQLSTADEVFNAFEFSGEGSDIILSISQFDYIYGGGYGGSDPNKWIANDMLKFGTTSVNGNLTFNLATEVNCIKITGYVNKTSCSIQVGDSNSTDWTSDTNDNKTSKVTCSNMTVTTKDTVEGNQTSTITIYFESTKDLKIAVTNKTPLYITSIEFIVDNQNNN